MAIRLTSQKKEQILTQVQSEIDFAFRYKEKKRTSAWQKNESMYYGEKPANSDERANLELGKMQEFVHTLLSKIDTPLVFKFGKKKSSDLIRAERANAMRRADANEGDWDMKDLLGKKQAVIYGRAIYAYHAENPGGFYKSVLENVDVYDFAIDPSCGGLDIERAMYMGRRNLILTTADLKAGVKDKIYNKAEVDSLLASGGNAQNKLRSDLDKDSRSEAVAGDSNREIGHNDKFNLTQWFTTMGENRYLVLMNESTGSIIRCEVWSDYDWPFWSWASYPDLTEFWTPAYCDYVREIFMAQNVSINQMMDNAEQIIRPQRAVLASAVKNKNQLKYKKGGYIELNGQEDINKVLRVLDTPSIKTPLDVYSVLDSIAEKASGVTASAKGVAEEDKVTIYKGNLQAQNDRFDFLNKSYTHGYKRFAKLYYKGLITRLTKKVAVEITGPQGVQMEEINRSQIRLPKGRDFNILVESSNTEYQVSFMEKQAKEMYLQSIQQDPQVNHKKVLELRGEIAGYKEEVLSEIFDVQGNGDSRLMAEADRDIETILDGNRPKANQKANIAYKRKIVDYMQSNSEYLSETQYSGLVDYIRDIDDIIMRNTVASATEKANEMMLQSIPGGSENQGDQSKQENPPVTPIPTTQTNPNI
jgi:hypothetical protein